MSFFLDALDSLASAADNVAFPYEPVVVWLSAAQTFWELYVQCVACRPAPRDTPRVARPPR